MSKTGSERLSAHHNFVSKLITGEQAIPTYQSRPSFATVHHFFFSFALRQCFLKEGIGVSGAKKKNILESWLLLHCARAEEISIEGPEG